MVAVDRIRSDFVTGAGMTIHQVKKLMATIREGLPLPTRSEDLPSDLKLPTSRIAEAMMDRADLKNIYAPSPQSEKRREGIALS